MLLGTWRRVIDSGESDAAFAGTSTGRTLFEFGSLDDDIGRHDAQQHALHDTISNKYSAGR
jgi:hypothetical protein